MATKKLSRALSAALAALLMATMLPFTALAAVTGFQDVNQGDAYAEAVDFLRANGYMIGTGNDSFSPSSPLTRAMAVTVLYRMAGEPEVKERADFSDVEDGVWYTDAITWAAQQGITKGNDDGTFAPGRDVTDVEAAMFVSRYEDLAASAPAEKSQRGQQQGGEKGQGGPQSAELTIENAAAKLAEAEAAADRDTAKNAYKALAEAYKTGSDKEGYVRKDIEKALEYYLKAAENGDALSYVEAGDIVKEKGDTDKAIEYYALASSSETLDRKNPKGYRNIGAIYDAEGDYEKALEYYTRALEELSDVSSGAYIGELYEDGKLGTVDLEKAAEYYLRAIAPKNYGAGGVSDALYSLGKFYENGLGGLKKDLGRAADMYTHASENKNADADAALANLYANAKKMTRGDFAMVIYALYEDVPSAAAVKNMF